MPINWQTQVIENDLGIASSEVLITIPNVTTSGKLLYIASSPTNPSWQRLGNLYELMPWIDATNPPQKWIASISASSEPKAAITRIFKDEYNGEAMNLKFISVPWLRSLDLRLAWIDSTLLTNLATGKTALLQGDWERLGSNELTPWVDGNAFTSCLENRLFGDGSALVFLPQPTRIRKVIATYQYQSDDEFESAITIDGVLYDLKSVQPSVGLAVVEHRISMLVEAENIGLRLFVQATKIAEITFVDMRVE